MSANRSASSAGKKGTKANTSARASSHSATTQKRGKSPSASEVDHTTYQVTDLEWLPIGQFQKHECCDCGLTHRIKYRIHEGVMQEQWTRDEKETRKQRKKK